MGGHGNDHGHGAAATPAVPGEVSIIMEYS